MFPPDELAAWLPPPRDDEPRPLRQDIIDELGDHLACALRRELLKERVGEGEAKRRVLARFGDPAALVRRLWRDALWEQIMSQRMLVGMCAVTLVLCIGTAAVTWAWVSQQSATLTAWKESQDSQRAEQNALFQKLVDQSTASTTALAARVDKLSESAASVPSEWNPVEYEFRADGKEGAPVSGVNVSIDASDSGTGLPSLNGVSDEKGIVRFDRVRYGRYRIAMWMDSGPVLRRNLVLSLGESLKKVIPCPVHPTPEKRDVHVRVHWPSELEDQSLYVYVLPASIWRKVDGVDWGWNRHQEQSWPPGQGFGRGEAGFNQPMTFYDSQGQPMAIRNGLQDVSNFGRSWRSDQPPARVTIQQELSSPDPSSTPQILSWPGAGFEIRFLGVLKRLEDDKQMNGYGGRSVQKHRRFGAIRLSAADWKTEVEDGEQPTLWLTPTPEAIKQITADLGLIQQMEEKSAERDKRRRSHSGDQPADEKTADPPTNSAGSEK